MPIGTFTAGTVVTAGGHNDNWALALLLDTGRTCTVTQTWTATQTFTGGFTSASTGTLTGLTFTLDLKSVTAFATPSALSATQCTAFASTVSGAALMGYGTTNDVALMNRAGTVVLGIGPNTTAVNLVGLMTFVTTISSVTAFATPSALAATTAITFASTVSGHALMGFGTTNDVALMNRAGTVCLGVGPNTTAVNIPGSLVLTGATVTGAPTWGSTQSLNTSGTAATVTTAAQTAITSVGTLTSLVVSGNIKGTQTGAGRTTSSFLAEAAAPAFAWYETDAGADAKLWDFTANAGALSLRVLDDASSAANSVFSVTRTGYASSVFTISSTTTAVQALTATTISGTTGTYTGILSTTAALAVAATQKFYFDGVAATGNTYMHEAAADQLVIYVGASPQISMTGSTVSTGGYLYMLASDTGGPSCRLPHGTAPTSPTNGDMWTTTAGLYIRINGATVGPLS